MDFSHVDEYELHNFFDDPNFDQFINLIRGENEEPVVNDIMDSYFLDSSPVEIGFDFNITRDTLVSSPGGREEDNDSSAATNVTATRKTKTDRSRTLVSERKRRGRMKEKLYALRSLVPNITKMDKASIVGDAVLYVQDMQMQAKKLKAEIENLEASLTGYQESIDNKSKNNINFADYNKAITKKIMKMDVFEVEEREFYVRLVCYRGEGIAASLYKALESLSNFCITNSNLVTSSAATAAHTFTLTFTINVMNCEQRLNLSNLKLWLTGAFINQGFDFY